MLISGIPCGWFTSLGVGSSAQYHPSLVYIKESIIMLYLEYTIHYLSQVTSGCSSTCYLVLRVHLYNKSLDGWLRNNLSAISKESRTAKCGVSSVGYSVTGSGIVGL